LDPLGRQFKTIMGKTRDIAPRMRKTFDQPTADRIDDIHENNRDCPGQGLKGNIDWSGMRDDQVGAQSYDLSDITTDALDVAPRPAKVDLDIAACAHGPAELPQIIKQRGNFSLPDARRWPIRRGASRLEAASGIKPRLTNGVEKYAAEPANASDQC